MGVGLRVGGVGGGGEVPFTIIVPEAPLENRNPTLWTRYFLNALPRRRHFHVQLAICNRAPSSKEDAG